MTHASPLRKLNTTRRPNATVLLVGACVALSGPALAHTESPLPGGQAAYAVMPVDAGVPGNDVVEAGDHLSIRVMGEEDLTGEYIVDDTGNFQFPLLGVVAAGGMNTRDLRDLLMTRLSRSYLRNPTVAIGVISRPAATFTVEGDVKEPGRYELGTGMTLLDAIAMAKSPNETAKLHEVAVFRQLHGHQYGARFNLKEIRAGLAPDPQIIQGDTVVVGSSGIKIIWHDVLQAAPLFNLFVLLR